MIPQLLLVHCTLLSLVSQFEVSNSLSDILILVETPEIQLLVAEGGVRLTLITSGSRDPQADVYGVSVDWCGTIVHYCLPSFLTVTMIINKIKGPSTSQHRH
jgi:hypothetical protein